MAEYSESELAVGGLERDDILVEGLRSGIQAGACSALSVMSSYNQGRTALIDYSQWLSAYYTLQHKSICFQAHADEPSNFSWPPSSRPAYRREHPDLDVSSPGQETSRKLTLCITIFR